VVAIEASQKARKWMSDLAYRQTASKSFEVAGFGEGAVEAQAFSRALPEISSIERLIVSAQRRLNAFLKELTERRDQRVATMRDTAELAIEKVSSTFLKNCAFIARSRREGFAVRRPRLRHAFHLTITVAPTETRL
jgi:hypothetical protein